MSFFSSAKAKLAASKLAEEQLYAQAAEEAASGQIRRGLWAKAIAETGGDEAAAKAHYLKLRVEIMRAEAEVTDFVAKEAAREGERYAADQERQRQTADQERQRQTAGQEQEEAENNSGLVDILTFIVMLGLAAMIAFAFGS